MTETINFEYTDLIVENDRILVYNQNQLVIYGLNGVKNTKESWVERSGQSYRLLPIQNCLLYWKTAFS